MESGCLCARFRIYLPPFRQLDSEHYLITLVLLEAWLTAVSVRLACRAGYQSIQQFILESLDPGPKKTKLPLPSAPLARIGPGRILLRNSHAVLLHATSQRPIRELAGPVRRQRHRRRRPLVVRVRRRLVLVAAAALGLLASGGRLGSRALDFLEVAPEDEESLAQGRERFLVPAQTVVPSGSGCNRIANAEEGRWGDGGRGNLLACVEAKEQLRLLVIHHDPQRLPCAARLLGRCVFQT